LRDGFAFANRFEQTISFRLPIRGLVRFAQMAYGLCGGMCFAALDCYYAGLPVPSDSDSPGLGTRLGNYLHRHQLDSFCGPVVPWRVLTLASRRDARLATLARQRVWPQIRAQLSRGEPVVLVLIRSRGWSHLTTNHQVVVVTCEEDVTAQQITLWLYDPNHPGQEPTLRFALGDALLALHGLHSTGEVDRGFFVQRYRPRKRSLPT
jgi:hypothetical protein